MKVVNSSIENALAVLELLAAQTGPMRLSEIADRLELPRSGTHRVLASLCARGWVEQDAQTELYGLSLKLPAIGYQFLHLARIPFVCQPILDRVAEQSRELVRLAAVTSSGLVTIADAQGARGSLVCQSRAFPVLPLHVTASGKVWLASLPKEEALKRVLSVGFGESSEYGPNAVTSVDALMADLEATRERGYGLSVEEAEPGVASVSVPVRPGGGEVVAALAIVAPLLRFDADRIEERVRIARQGATDLEVVWPLHQVVEWRRTVAA